MHLTIRTIRVALVLAVLAALLGNTVLAQPIPENHYKVYETVPDPTFSVPGLTILDQWTDFTIEPPDEIITLDKFANPVDKNGEGFVDFDAHQTWWQIFDPEPGRIVEIDNQFGRQTIFTTDGVYLVLPALKNQQGNQQEVFARNHYKCYTAEGPPIDATVVLIDQFGTMTSVIAEPVLFCNPAEKVLPDGTTFPPMDPTMHQTCYRFDPPMPPMMIPPIVAEDQFGFWSLEVMEPLWLCVPSQKIQFVGVEDETWSNIKKLYH